MSNGNIVNEIRNWIEFEEKFVRDTRQLDRDMYRYEEGSQKYRDLLNRMGYIRGKGLEQLESIKTSPTVKETIKFVEAYVEKNEKLIASIQSTYQKNNKEGLSLTEIESVIAKSLKKSNIKANIMGLESVTWEKIKVYI